MKKTTREKIAMAVIKKGSAILKRKNSKKFINQDAAI